MTSNKRVLSMGPDLVFDLTNNITGKLNKIIPVSICKNEPRLITEPSDKKNCFSIQKEAGWIEKCRLFSEPFRNPIKAHRATGKTETIKQAAPFAYFFSRPKSSRKETPAVIPTILVEESNKSMSNNRVNFFCC